MQVVILAGGLGTRLRPITEEIPKPMVPIHGRPFLEYLIVFLRNNGLTKLLLLVGHLRHKIISHFGDGKSLGVHISYAEETTLLGNGGALRAAYEQLDDAFLLLYGDTYLPIDYQDFARSFIQSQKKAAVVVYRYRDSADRGDDAAHNLCIDDAGLVVDFNQHGLSSANAYVESGALALKKEIVRGLPEKHENSLGNVLFPRLIAERELQAYVTDKRFYDIGTPFRLQKAVDYFKVVS